MNKPKIGDTRVRSGFLETYEMVHYPGWPAGNDRDDPTWVRGKLVDGARAVTLYSVAFAYHDAHITLGPGERIVAVSELGGGSRCAWVEQDDHFNQYDLRSGS